MTMEGLIMVGRGSSFLARGVNCKLPSCASFITQAPVIGQVQWTSGEPCYTTKFGAQTSRTERCRYASID